MSNINTISPNNTFSDIQKNSLNTFIKIISEKDSELSEDKLKFLSSMLMAIGSCGGNADLVRWLLENNYIDVNACLSNSHIKFANNMGFNFELLPTEFDMPTIGVSSLTEDSDEMPDLGWSSDDMEELDQSIASRTRSQTTTTVETDDYDVD